MGYTNGYHSSVTESPYQALFTWNPGSTQKLNRYSYMLNNPLRYVDSLGYRYTKRVSASGEDECWISGFTYPGGGWGSNSIGSGNYWSDQYLGVWGSFMMMNSSMFQKTYGQDLYNTIVGAISDGKEIDKIVEGYRNGVKGYWINYKIDDPIHNSDKTNVTVGLSVISTFFVIETPSGGGVEWKGVTNATVGLIGGVAEMVVGGASEYFSAGSTTTISGPLMLDGGVRTVTNAQRLFQYFNGNTNLANAYPTSLGGLAGKGIDMALGTSVYKVGLGQSIGSMGNDFISFIATGGTGGALFDLMKTPSVSTGFNYFFTVGSYPYSMYYDKPDK